MKKTIALLPAILLALIAGAQDTALYQRALFIRNGDTLRYRLLYPESRTSQAQPPLIVFLHGSGERGNDNAAQLVHGGDLFVKPEIRQQFPAIVIFPQCPADEYWSELPRPRDTAATAWLQLNKGGLTKAERLVKLLTDSLVKNKRVDKKRIYLGGLSLGGFGTYDLAIHFPNYFAAIFPICGQANRELYMKVLAKKPVWIFHGELDPAVNVQPDRDLFKMLQTAGSTGAKYTEYPGVGHDSWNNAFAEPGLLPWLFDQHL